MKLEINKFISPRGSNDTNELLCHQGKTFNKDQEVNQLNINNNFINEELIQTRKTNRFSNQTTCKTDNKSQEKSFYTTVICTPNALFLNYSNNIYIPNKVLTVLRRHISKHLLKKVDPDVDTAIEYCLLFFMQLSSSSFVNNNQSEEGWKSLNSKYLRQFFSTSPDCYKKIITTLSTPTNQGILIECDGRSIKGVKNYHYRLGDNYRGKGYSNYTLHTTKAKYLLENYHQKKWDKAQGNLICQNLIQFYQSVTLPSLAEIENEAERLISGKYKDKKRKTLKRLNKHAKSYFKDDNKYCFVEDAIKIFERLTIDGVMIPIAGGDASGGRVVDSFALMPSWIRKLVKVNGTPMVECDYACLHPNIAVAIYGGISKNITHKKISESLGIDDLTVKVEHLSFFNKEVWQMIQSPLYSYYNTFDNWMLNNIINEKQADSHKHKITSRRLFAKEVEIMTEVIKILNEESIYVGYVYDALFFDPANAERVKKVMDQVSIQFDVFTHAKLS